MLDADFIRQHSDIIRQATLNKQLDPKVVDDWLEIDTQRRELLGKVEGLRAKVNANAQEIKLQLQAGAQKPDTELVTAGRELKSQLKDLETLLRQVEEDFQLRSLALPNIPADDVPVGADESGNQVVRQVGQKPQFDFTPRSHLELMEMNDLVDIKNAVRIGGFRSYFLKNDAVLLEQAILNYALKMMTKAGFTALSVPVLVRSEFLTGTGYFPWGKEDHYQTQDEQILAGTAEVALTSFYGDQVLNEKDLPIKLVGVSPCFRREVGTYGKDMQGIIRVHQFNKVEQVVLTAADEDITRDWHQKMVGFAEQLLTDFGLAYQVLLMCSGDMGASQRKKYDLETWFPAQDRYRETHSASYFNDFQARRLNIKYRANDGKTKFVYTLNNTVAATPRLLAAVLENYQNKDGTINIPQVLQPYMNGQKIINNK